MAVIDRDQERQRRATELLDAVEDALGLGALPSSAQLRLRRAYNAVVEAANDELPCGYIYALTGQRCNAPRIHPAHPYGHDYQPAERRSGVLDRRRPVHVPGAAEVPGILTPTRGFVESSTAWQDQDAVDGGHSDR